MGSPLDLRRQVFGRLTVLSVAADGNPRGRLWLCRCACGTEVKLYANTLRSGHTNSCGCLQRDKARASVKTHGMWQSPTYQSWRAMLNRCYNPRDPSYAYCGSRGIIVCERWRASFENFLADMGARPEGKTIDRIDNDGNYEKSNCRWATRKEQDANKRDLPHWRKRRADAKSRIQPD